MPELKATPGPWYVTEADGPFRVREEASDAILSDIVNGGHLDDSIDLIGPNEQEANAHLIAAAPDLYEALETICQEFAQQHPLIKRGRTALSRARGDEREVDRG